MCNQNKRRCDESEDHASVDLGKVGFKKRSEINTISNITFYKCVPECFRAFRTNNLQQLSIHKLQCRQYKEGEEKNASMALQLQQIANDEDEAISERLRKEKNFDRTEPEHIAFNFIEKTGDFVNNSADIKVCIRKLSICSVD